MSGTSRGRKHMEGLRDLEVKVSSLERNVGSLSEKHEFLDKGSRRLNIVVGYVEEEGKSEEDKVKIAEFVKERFQVEVDRGSISRIGSRREGCRLALVSLRSFTDKVKSLRNAKVLKGTRVFVSPDFSKEERSKRKVLVSEMKKLRREGKKAFVHYWENMLIVEGEEVEVEISR